MQGRLENDFKVTETTKVMLKELPDYVERWYLKLRASDHQPKNCQVYINIIRNYLRYINKDPKKVQLIELTSVSLDHYMITVQTKINSKGEITYTSASYQKSIWSALNNFFTYLYKSNLITSNYMEDISRTRESDEERINEHRILLTKEDFNNIIKVVRQGVGSTSAKSYQLKFKNRDLSIFYLFMTTGMRREEIREININDINFEEKKISIITKGKRIRNLILSDKVLCYIKEWIRDRNNYTNIGNDALFVNKYGKRMSGQAIYELVDKYCTEALGYHISPHKLRSGFCSILLEEWGDIHAVMKAVGHKRVETTLRYAVTKNEEQKEAANLISNSLFN